MSPTDMHAYVYVCTALVPYLKQLVTSFPIFLLCKLESIVQMARSPFRDANDKYNDNQFLKGEESWNLEWVKLKHIPAKLMQERIVSKHVSFLT